MPICVEEGLDRFADRLSLRSNLMPADRRAVLKLTGRAVEFGANRDVVLPGHRNDVACLVVTGRAGRFDQMADGRRQLTAIHLPGDLCDLHSVAVPMPGWGISALSPLALLQIPHGQILELVKASPALAMAFWRDTVVDGSILAKWVSNLGRRDSRGRLAHLLCELGIRMEQARLGARDHFELKLTQAQLADILGLTSVHVNRVFQALRAEGLVATEQGMVRIADVRRLASVADFDPAYLLLGQA